MGRCSPKKESLKAFQLDGKFEWFLEKFGPPKNSQPTTNELLEKYHNCLPNRLLEYWQEYGYCSFKDGLLWIVNPDDYRDTMNTWLRGTEILEFDNFHVFARSGFGELYLWGEKTGQHFNIEMINGVIFSNGSNEKYIEKVGANEAIKNFFTVIKPYSIDLDDIDADTPIFEQAVDKFGPLKEDEMFTFEPALFLGGEQTLKTVNKVNLFIQSEILADMGQREIMDIKGLAKKAFGK